MPIPGTHNLQILRGLTTNRSLLSCNSNGETVDLWDKDDGSGRQEFRAIEIAPGIYNLVVEKGVSSDRKYLSTNTEGTTVDLWGKDDGSGRQRWTFTPIRNSPTCEMYLIKVVAGVTGDRAFLSCSEDGTRVDLWPDDDGSGRQRWQLQKPWTT